MQRIADRLHRRIQRCLRLRLRDSHGRVSRLAVCLTRRFRVPFYESALARTRLLGTFLTRNNVDFVSLTDLIEVKFGVSLQSVLEFMYEVRDCLVRLINFVTNVVGCVFFHFANDMKHFRDRKLMFRKDSLSETVKDTITVPILVALRTLSSRSFLDRVRTA